MFVGIWSESLSVAVELGQLFSLSWKRVGGSSSSLAPTLRHQPIVVRGITLKFWWAVGRRASLEGTGSLRASILHHG